MKTKKILILGAAGRDFHNFNVVFRGDPEYNVVAFTANRFLASPIGATPPNLLDHFTQLESRFLKKKISNT